MRRLAALAALVLGSVGRLLLVTDLAGSKPRPLGRRVADGFVQPAGWSRAGSLFTRREAPRAATRTSS